jgi:hypothetical protein
MTAAGVVHGSWRAYKRDGCRCEPCRALQNEYAMQRRQKLRGTLSKRDRRHGTLNGYNNYGCRCPRCRRAKREYVPPYRLVGAS